MMALPSLWVASGEAPAQERFANVHYRRAFLLLRRKSELSWTRVRDYTGLVRLLPMLSRLVDACGEVILTPGEAEKIQTLGFPAHAGRWPVPPIPLELVAGNDL